MKTSLLKVSLIFLTLVAVVSCGFDIKEIHPQFLDTKRGYSRKYEFYKVKPNKCGDPDFDVRDTGVRTPINEMNGQVCFSLEEAQKMYSYYLKYHRDQQKCPVKTKDELK